MTILQACGNIKKKLAGDHMIDIKKTLREFGLTQKEFAEKLELSRPTLDTYIQLYESGKEIPKEKYRIIFSCLFENDYSREEFENELQDLIGLLERDKRYGTADLSAEASDYVSTIMNQMRKDLRSEEWNRDIYCFINILLSNYKTNKIFKELSSYFVYLNGIKKIEEIQEEQISYLANYYKVFHELKETPEKYERKDYEAFLVRCQEIDNEKKQRQEKKKEALKEQIHKMLVEKEKLGVELSEEDIIHALREQLVEKKEN